MSCWIAWTKTGDEDGGLKRFAEVPIGRPFGRKKEMYLLSTVVTPSFRSATLRIEELTREQFAELLAQVDVNLCGHPATNAVLRQIRPDLPEPVKAFWQGDGTALAARPKGGVRGASVAGDTPVSLADLEFCKIEYVATQPSHA